MAGQNQGENESVEAFVNRRQRQAAALAFARANAHQAYGQNIRVGQDLDLQQPTDLAAYGLQPPSPSNPSAGIAGNPVATDDSSHTPQPLLPVDAAIRSAANTVSFGGADKFAAAMDTFTGGGLNRWGKRYDANLQQEQAHDRYDAAHAPLAWSVGGAGGGLLGLLTFGPEEALAVAPRLAGAAKLTAKEVAGIVGAGGLAGFGSQTLSDIATNHPSTPADIIGAIAGGMAGAGALPLGPARAGAVDGGVTLAAQDFLNGRPVSIPQVAQGALAGQMLGGIAGRAGRNWSNGLSTNAKGQLGEMLGDMRSKLNGEQRVWAPKQRAPLEVEGDTPPNSKRTYWYPDGFLGPIQRKPKVFEDKFGYNARLSPNQAAAQAQLGDKFQLNHFLPEDIALMTGLPVAGFGPQVVNQAQHQ